MFFEGAFRAKKIILLVFFGGGDDWPRLIGRGAVGFLISIVSLHP